MKYFLLFILAIANVVAYGQLTAVKGQTTCDFWLNLPADSILNDQPPVLIFLHGRSLSGTDLARVKQYGVISEIEKGREIPAITIAPQVPKGSYWKPELVLEVLDYVLTKYNADSNRVYVCGMSMGGYGTMHFAGKYPERITAGVALCGGGNTSEACHLAQMPFWIQHGTADKAVPVSESRNMVNAIKSCNGGKHLLYREIEGANHGAMERVFRSDELYEWLLKQSKQGT